jgi:hypothetical protein
MSKSPIDNKTMTLPEAIAHFSKVFADETKKADHLRDIEAARRARLTPEQRQREDDAREQQRIAAWRAEQNHKLAKLNPSIWKRDTFTLIQFARLLAAKSPDTASGFTLDSSSSELTNEQQQLKSVLESCVGTQLHPVNPSAPATQHRFTASALVGVASAKRLGCADILVSRFTASAPAIATSNPKTPTPPAALGTITRERAKRRRRKAVLAFAQSLAADGHGTTSSTEIELNMHSGEFNRRFWEKHADIPRVGDKSLEADRRTCTPKITMKDGRPLKIADEVPYKKNIVATPMAELTTLEESPLKKSS